MKFRRAFCLVFAALLPLAAAGCLFGPDHNNDDNNNTPPPPPPPRLASAPDTLMAMFRLAYTGMDSVQYAAVLHPNFRFLFNPTDVTRLNLPSNFLTRAQDLRSSANMFTGDSIVKPEGTIPGVAEIKITQLDRTEPWVIEGPDNPDFPNTQRATFNIEMSIARLSNATYLLLSGQQIFYVAARDTLINGANVHYYQLRGQRDLTSIAGKATEQSTWGGVKDLYLGQGR